MGGAGYHSSRGGSAVKIVSDNLLLNGHIDMNGGAVNYAGGAGGSAWLVVKKISGRGSVTANGGRYHYSWRYGGGSGGRIALYAEDIEDFTGRLKACAGFGSSSYGHGSPGTVYKFINSTVERLIFDNCGYFSDHYSMIMHNADGYRRNNTKWKLQILQITNGARIRIGDENSYDNSLTITDDIVTSNLNHHFLVSSNNTLTYMPTHIHSNNFKRLEYPKDTAFNSNYRLKGFDNEADFNPYRSGLPDTLFNRNRPDYIIQNTNLYVNQILLSRNHKYFAVLEADGKFSLFKGKSTNDISDENRLWSHHSSPSSNFDEPRFRLRLKDDGDLVIYDNPVNASESKIWNTGSISVDSYFLVVQNDGNIVIYKGVYPDDALSDNVIWQSNTVQPSETVSRPSDSDYYDEWKPTITVTRDIEIGKSSLLGISNLRLTINWNAKLNTNSIILFVDSYLIFNGAVTGASSLYVFGTTKVLYNIIDSYTPPNVRFMFIRIGDSASVQYKYNNNRPKNGEVKYVSINVAHKILITENAQLQVHGLSLEINSNEITLLDNSAINGHNGGYYYHTQHSSCYSSRYSGYYGGVHGGSHGRHTAPYNCGNFSEPNILGSAGYHSSQGGAAVKINARALHVNGHINMNGGAVNYAGGAGGSIWLNIINSVTGTGKITANGGRYHYSWRYGGGSGGRIAVYAKSTSGFKGTIQACGGFGSDANGHAGPGSVYFERNGVRDLLFDNCGYFTNHPSKLIANAEMNSGEVIKTVTLKRGARVQFGGNNDWDEDELGRLLYNVDRLLGDRVNALHISGESDFYLGFSGSYYAETVGRANWTVVASNSNPELTITQNDKVAVGTAIFDQVNMVMLPRSVTFIPKMLRICMVSVTLQGGFSGLEETSYCLNHPPTITGAFVDASIAGSLSLKGCGHPGALNYNSGAAWDPKSPGACRFPDGAILGCTYDIAPNYNSLANVDDFGCDIPEIYNPNPDW
jgi:hypothetical protein